MINQLTFLIFFFTVLQFHAQDNDIEITGKIINDSLSIENIHIINKNSGKATISNQYGEFKIPVKVNDTLVFSGIQFYIKEIRITKKIIRNKTITVKLFQKINELDEVEVKTHNLSGSLVTDANNVKGSVSKMNPMALDFSMIDFKKTVILDIDEIDMKRAPDITHLVSPIQPGISASIGLKKYRTKEEKKLKKIKKDDEIFKDIRHLVTDNFFIQTLKIPYKEIDTFLKYCTSKGIVDLYIKNRKMEVIDLLIKESSEYRKFKGLD